jgi:signal transduction histidine kinase/ligand-binding sensor domain-containing protein
MLKKFAIGLGMTLGLMALPCAASAASREPPTFRTIDQWVRTIYTAKDGVPRGIESIAQDARGFLWLGTSDGMFRFDGQHFERRLAGKLGEVNTMYAAKDGSLWTGGKFGTIGHIAADGTLTTWGPPQLPSATVMFVTQMPDGVLWAVSYSGVQTFAGGTWKRRQTESDGIPRELIYQAFQDPHDRLWIVTALRAYRLDPGSPRFVPDTQEAAASAMLDRPGTSWRPADITNDEVSGADESLWVPTTRGVVRLHWEAGASPGALPVQEQPTPGDGAAASAVFRDRSGAIWAAAAGTLEQFRVGKITPLPHSINTRNALFTADATGRLWIAARNSDALATFDGRLERWPMEVKDVGALATGPDGTAWMVGNAGLYHHVSGHWLPVPLPPTLQAPSAVTTPFHDLVLTSDGTVWMNSLGLWRLKDGAWTGPDALHGLPSPSGSPTVLHAKGNTVWAGYTGDRLASIDEPGLLPRMYAATDGLAVGNLLALADSKHGLWVAGDAGLQLLRSDGFARLIGVGGERFANITGIVERPDGELWLNGVSGLFRIDPADMAAWLRDTDRPVTFELMDERDGRPGSPLSYRVNSLVAGKGNRLWVGSDREVAFIDTDRIMRTHVAPMVVIDSINGERPSAAPLALGKSVKRADIAFTAPVLGVPERAQFRYRLVGAAPDEWTTTSERRATFTNLAPGDYRFEVEAANEDGVWSRSPAQARFLVAPAFYQTWWFRALCVLAALTLVYLAYLMRVRHLGILICARLLERESIARDFHDTVLQSLHAVLLRTKVATDAVTDEDARNKLEKAMEATHDALVEGREKIATLRGDRESPSLLPARIETLAGLLGSVSDARFSLTVIGETRSVNPAAEEDIHAVVSEMLSNAFRHAGAGSINATVVFRKRSLTVSVHDDGVGMDVKKMRNRPHRPGWGLVGMQERAQRLASKLVMQSVPGEGMTATIVVPGPVAYWLPRTTVARLRGRRWALW